MPKTIIKVSHKPRLAQQKKVAAYARVSTGKDAMLHSLSSQVSYYSKLIQGHEGWSYVGVYADEALSGTKDSRENFQKLLADCCTGKVDMIITKSISRFARNTVILLQTARELKALGVDIYFEEQNIHTLSSEGELMLTILASYAQEESRSASDNQKWRIKKNFEEGMPWNGTILGYRYEKGQYIIVPEEAEPVKRIFDYYLSGLGCGGIAKRLNSEGYTTRGGKRWYRSTILKILMNYTYTGNLLLQKTYRENHMTKRAIVNHGELPRYHAADTHEPIISTACFEAVQAEITRRAAEFKSPKANKQPYPFTGLMVCDICGKNYRRKVTRTGPVWVCATFNTVGKDACNSKQIPEETLKQAAADALGTDTFDERFFGCTVDGVRVCENNTLVFRFKDGIEVSEQWKDRSRAESWTDEMRDAARQRVLERRKS